MEKHQNTLAIVIKSQSIRESDILVTLLTPNLGKIVATAKGAKQIKSSRLGSLQLGNTIKAHLYTKNGYTWLSEATSISQFLLQPKQLTQINLLFYFLEIINNFIAQDQYIPQVYEISEKIIQSIADNQLAQFIDQEIKLISVLGFGLPEEITHTFKLKEYVLCQKLIRQHLESILEKPLQSGKMFS
jgi:DNA repair protein RecO